MAGETWNLDGLLERSSPDEILEEIKKKVEKFKAYKKNLKDDIKPAKLKEIIVFKENLRKISKRIGAYYYLKWSENNDDSEILAKMSFWNQFSVELNTQTLFFSIWLIELDDKVAKKLIEADELKDYKYYLQLVRKDKPYTKSEEIEKIISFKSVTDDAFSSLYDVFTNAFTFDFNGKKGLSQEEVSKHYQDEKEDMRVESYKTILSKYKESSTLLSEMYKNIVLDWYNEGIKIREHKSPISIRNHDNDIDDKIVETLLKVVRKNSNIFKEYFELKHKLQEKKGNKYKNSRFNLYAPYKIKQKEYSYEKSKKIVLNTYKEFDERFYKAAKQIFDKKHVHSHPKTNKRSGAFCWGVHNELIPYVFLNHTDSLKDVFTMMHEFGHGIHDIFSMKQVDLSYSIPLPMAETASVFSEMVLADKLLNETDDKEEKIFILMKMLNSQYGTIMRQSYFTIFEKFAHDKIKDGITKEELEQEWMKLLKEQFGDMEIHDLFKNEWNYIPHFYHSPFYCYAYAWGNLVVLALYAMYKEQGKDFIEKYIEFLSAGGSDSPVNLLSNIGIDPSDENFWQKGFDIIKKEIEQLKALSE